MWSKLCCFWRVVAFDFTWRLPFLVGQWRVDPVELLSPPSSSLSLSFSLSRSRWLGVGNVMKRAVFFRIAEPEYVRGGLMGWRSFPDIMRRLWISSNPSTPSNLRYRVPVRGVGRGRTGGIPSPFCSWSFMASARLGNSSSRFSRDILSSRSFWMDTSILF